MCRLRETSKLDFDMHDENDTPITYVHIDASLNYFESIPNAFETCAAGLRSLDLSLNQIRRPHSVAVFAGLTVLKMARNGIEALPDNFVSGCTHLCELDLSCNKLSTLPRLDELVNLRSLNLRGNQFAVLQGVATLRSLESLNLASNMLQDIADLARVQTLCTLDLASNQLDDLLEVRDIILCLPKLEELKLLGNPVSRERNYRMVIYENPSIVKFDSAKVTKGARDQWKQRKLQADMNHIVHETSTHYMRWIEMEARQKQAALDMLRKREQEIENAFVAYRKSMEAELEECIQYIQDLAENPHEYDASFLGSIDGHKQWQAYLDAADAARAKTHEEELLRLRSALEQRVLIKAETDAYAGKLRLLARERPSVWQDIKRKELASRAIREEIDDAESANIRDAREAARARLNARANERSDLLAEAALDADLSLS
ncbi:Leucine-rich repeat-containing protein 7 [Hondaea fermentalgiana]|uniref:Leucine-rich repeat-containing protein 7 n=1 Tax=Hondaea fermentalgiana TaxID=2315210 RepID=A0A2R5GB86_9STRA|nr:Leucine-rich repeat-containing protein 7 [Hondaea fermentalgiana]|eukprot:GBG24964.1 Leucine-rich repeat-containing protein 7 [Hondaea fermentalgiana]